jgi:hypothetical protein
MMETTPKNARIRINVSPAVRGRLKRMKPRNPVRSAWLLFEFDPFERLLGELRGAGRGVDRGRLRTTRSGLLRAVGFTLAIGPSTGIFGHTTAIPNPPRILTKQLNPQYRIH